MIIHGRVLCDLCHQHIGQVWNEPVCAPDLLPAPAFHVCADCHTTTVCSCGLPGCWYAINGGGCFSDLPISSLGSRPQFHPVR
jgi:hypothetical protein